MNTSEETNHDEQPPDKPSPAMPAAKPAAKPAPKPAPKPAAGLGWLWATLGACVFAAGVGVAVYFYMTWQHGQSVDAQVQQAVAEASAAAQQQPQGPPPATVRVAQASEQTARRRVMVVGRLMEVKRSTVASEVEGKVVELLAPAGRDVVGGETVIARVDPVWSKLAVEEAQADLAAAKATAQQSSNELKNLEALAQRSAADPQEIDEPARSPRRISRASSPSKRRCTGHRKPANASTSSRPSTAPSAPSSPRRASGSAPARRWSRSSRAA